jgi:hypothetical protein
MKNIVLGLSLAAALAAPLAASAQTQPAPLPAGHYLLVDVQTGRTIGELVAVAAEPQALRAVGAVATGAAPLFPHIQTIGQSSDDLRKAFNEQFGIVPSP